MQNREIKEQKVTETFSLKPEMSGPLSYLWNRPKYDYEAMLTLIDNGEDGCNHSAYKLAKKASKQGSRLTIMSWHGSDFKAFSKVTRNSRLYVEGHCAPGELGLHSRHHGDPLDVKKTPEDFVEFLQKHASQLMEQTSPSKRVKIIVIGCNAAKKSGSSKSYCEVLSRKLEEAGIYAVVHGYNGKLRVGSIKEKDQYRVAKLVNDEHRPKGYKSIFVNGYGTLVDERPSSVGSTVLALGIAAIGVGAVILGHGKK